MVEVSVDSKALEASMNGAEKAIKFLEDPETRKTLIEAGNEGLMNALRKHFASREKEPHSTFGFPWFGQSYPKKYFWRGTRGTSVAEKMKVTLSSPARLEGRITIESPALAHKLDPSPPEIKPKGGRKFLAIPANPTAAQWDGMPRDFPGGLRFAFSKLPSGAWLASLVAAANYKRSQKGKTKLVTSDNGGEEGENEVVYWLVHKVETAHDPNALPKREAQTLATSSAIRIALQRILQKSAPSTPS